MLSVEHVVERVRRHVERHFWDADEAARWPARIPLGTPSGTRIGERSLDVMEWAGSIRQLCERWGLGLVEAGKKLGFTGASLPVAVTVPSETSALEVAGLSGKARTRNRRLEALAARGLSPADAMRVARGFAERPPIDFEIALGLGDWARAHETRGLTPRQLPVPGVQGKALNSRGDRELVALMAGREALGLVDRPRLVAVKHLDPSSPTRFAMSLVGTGDPADEGTPPYEVDLVVIVENRDTFVDFPLIPRSACVLGDGRACLGQVPEISWVRRAPRVAYWGDMDLAGLEIMSDLRLRGVACESMLMDLAAFRRYEALGTSLGTNGRRIDPSHYPEDPPAGLHDGERGLWDLIRNRTRGATRVEQEKIPYDDALSALEDAWPGASRMD